MDDWLLYLQKGSVVVCSNEKSSKFFIIVCSCASNDKKIYNKYPQILYCRHETSYLYHFGKVWPLTSGLCFQWIYLHFSIYQMFEVNLRLLYKSHQIFKLANHCCSLNVSNTCSIFWDIFFLIRIKCWHVNQINY